MFEAYYEFRTAEAFFPANSITVFFIPSGSAGKAFVQALADAFAELPGDAQGEWRTLEGKEDWEMLNKHLSVFSHGEYSGFLASGRYGAFIPLPPAPAELSRWLLESYETYLRSHGPIPGFLHVLYPFGEGSQSDVLQRPEYPALVFTDDFESLEAPNTYLAILEDVHGVGALFSNYDKALFSTAWEGDWGYNWDAFNDVILSLPLLDSSHLILAHEALSVLPPRDFGIYMNLLLQAVLHWQQRSSGDRRLDVRLVFRTSDRARVMEAYFGTEF